MEGIFKQIDAIEWNQLGHAYGSAEDVPASLKVLFDSNNEEAAKEVLSSFFGNIYHQGTIYSATAYAVPFLIQALNYCPINVKHTLIELLMCIANGMSYNIQHESMWSEGGILDDGRVETDEYKEETRKQLHWVETGILNVWEGWEEFLALLNYQDANTRMKIHYLLVSLATSNYYPENMDKETINEKVWTLFLDKLTTETDSLVKASLIMGMNCLSFPKEKKISFLKYYLEEDNLLGIISAYCILHFEVNDTAIDILCEAAPNKGEIDDKIASLPWFDFRFSFSLLQILCILPSKYTEKLWPIFEDYIKNTFEFGTEYTVTPIVNRIFEKQKIDEIKEPLPDMQKKVITTILNTPTLWKQSDGNTSGEFRKWGLERDKTHLENLINN